MQDLVRSCKVFSVGYHGLCEDGGEGRKLGVCEWMNNNG